MRYHRTCSLFVSTLALLLSAAAAVLAQSTSAATQNPGAEVRTTTVDPANAAQGSAPEAAQRAKVATGEERTAQTLATLGELRKVLGQYPPSVGFVIALDHVLLTNAEFLGAYPALAAFLDAHPEIRRNPAFYFPARRQPYEGERENNDVALAGILAGIIVPLGFLAFLGGAAYLAHQHKTAALKTRQETTAKVVDGLLARADLVAHLDTPAGRRLMNSLTQQPEPAPASRILRSVQAGIVLTFLGAGFGALRLLFVIEEENRLGFATAGIVLATIGLGLLVSAGASYLLSKRFGLIETSHSRD